MFRSLIICSIGLTLTLAGCGEKQPVQQQRLLVDMARLDRVYIPAVIFTELGRQREAELAAERLRRSWSDFHDHYYRLKFKYGRDITDKFWQEDLDRVSQAVATAEALVGERELARANRELLAVRLVLRDLRRRNGLGYFLDGLTDFYASIGAMRELLAGKDKLKERERDYLRTLLQEAQSSLVALAQTDLDPQLFNFDEQKIAAVRRRLQAEEQLLQEVATVFPQEKPEPILAAVVQLKPNLDTLYRAFGDLQPLLDQVVRERKAKEQEEAKAKEEAKTKVSTREARKK